ncbi:MAG: hypothetical protein J6Y24_10545 [Bacteroidales bacterium]|nr:hypothetical protein [Bacteroidales bacterium]
MKNVFFPDEDITEDDLYFVCYMIEKVSRQIKQPNRYTVNKMGYNELAKKLSSANVLHSQNPLQTASEWIEEFSLEDGTFDVSAVNPDYCQKIPSETQMGKVYKRLILNTMQVGEDFAQAIVRVYNNDICNTLDNYNCSAYYEPSPYIARSYFAGGF